MIKAEIFASAQVVLIGFSQQDPNPKSMELISSKEEYGVKTSKILKSITKLIVRHQPI